MEQTEAVNTSFFAAGSKILTDDGYKKVEDIKKEDNLYTHMGNFQSVIRNKKRIILESCIELKSITNQKKY